MKVNQLKVGVLLSYVNLFAHTIISLSYTPIMIRLLGQSEYGLYNTSASIINSLGILNFGFGSAYIRYYAKYKNKDNIEVDRINGIFILIFTIIGVIVLFSGYIIIKNIEVVYGDGLTQIELNQARVLMAIMLVNLAISMPGSVFNSIITAHEQFFYQRMLVLLKSILNPLLVLPLLLIGYKSIALVLISTVLTIGSFIFNIWYCKIKLNIKFRFDNLDYSLIKDMWGFSFFVFLHIIMDKINWQVDKLLLGRYQGTISVAVYSVGALLNSFYLQFSTAISSVFVPRVHLLISTKGAKGSKGISELFAKVGRIQFIVITYILFSFVFFGKQFILFWAGREYEISYYVALLLMFPLVLPLTQNLGLEILRAKNIHKVRAIINFFISLGNIVITIPLCIRYGAIGAALGTTISTTIGAAIISNIYYQKIAGIDIIYFLSQLVKILPSLVPPLAVGVYINRFVQINLFINFVISASVYTLIYFISIWILGMNTYEKQLINMSINKIWNIWAKRR